MQRVQRRVRQDGADAMRSRRCWGVAARGGTGSWWCCCGFPGCGIGEALGLRRSDLHLCASARALGCSVPGPHLHVVDRDGNPNGAHAKSGDHHVPVRPELLACYDHYLAERAACRPAQACDFVLVNLFHEPLGRPMSDHSVRQWLAASSRQPGWIGWSDRTCFATPRPTNCSHAVRDSMWSRSCWARVDPFH